MDALFEFRARDGMARDVHKRDLDVQRDKFRDIMSMGREGDVEFDPPVEESE